MSRNQPASPVSPDDVIEAAREWIDVKWKHQGRTKDGVDCVGILYGVAGKFGRKFLDERNYSHNPGSAKVFEQLGEVCDRVPINQRRKGDIGVLQINTPEPWHTVIFSDAQTIIHAHALDRKVVETGLGNFESHIKRVYRPRVYSESLQPTS